jgi:hypothetical protein
MLGISIKAGIGIGDAIQYSSLPENYFNSTGKKLVDISKPWFFDFNPYVERGRLLPSNMVREMWNFPMQYQWPRVRVGGTKAQVYMSNAEIWAGAFGVKVTLNRPRLYRFEEMAYENRQTILFQTQGRSHGIMPDNVIEHVLCKYRGTGNLIHIGPGWSEAWGIPHLETKEMWDLAQAISQARIFIGLDSGPAWIAACYPDVVVKKLRTRPRGDILETWVPLEIDNLHSHWDDRCAQIFNCSEHDIAFTSSYRKI